VTDTNRTTDQQVSNDRLRELIRAYADCGCGLGPHAACVDTGRALRELEGLKSLLVDIREKFLHLKRRVRHARGLLSGEFYNEALGEIDDALGDAAL
jgi:hypothetical protein